MPLHLIHGPPNTGRTGLVQQEFLSVLGRDPVLVVPGVDDIFTWERRLSRESGALVGARIKHFKDLADEILRQAGMKVHPRASELQRRHLATESIRSTWPELRPRLQEQPGLVASMLDLIDDFRANLIDPETLTARTRESPARQLGLICAVYEYYLDRLESNRLSDAPGRQLLATKLDHSAWSGTPIYIAGFDDLTRQQLELVIRLSRHTDVTVVMTHEIGNPAMALTAALFSDLDGAGAVVKEATDRSTGGPDHATQLLEVEKRFMRSDSEKKLEPDDAVRVMRSAGKRNEAEAVAGEIAKLVDAGTPPGDIAISLDSPSAEGPLFRDLLLTYGVPVTLESEVSAASTATGASALALLAATGPSGTASDLLRFLRGPGGPEPEAVDLVERRVLQGLIESASGAVKIVRDRGIPTPPSWDELVEAGDDGAALAKLIGPVTTGIGSAILERDPEQIPSSLTLTETQAATAISRACKELVSIGSETLTRQSITDGIGSDAVKIWAVPAEGTTRIASPYSLRAKRVRHLFYASLQERGILDKDRSGPFLTPKDRETIALPEYTDPELQARYLFYSALTVPTEGLWLSCRIADETGKAEYPSPLIGAVEDLFENSAVNPDGVNPGRTGSDLTFDPAAAPSLDEFARAVAAKGPDDQEKLTAELEPAVADGILTRLAEGRATEERTRHLGDLSKAITDSLADQELFSATGVETYAGCPYSWFIERQIRPLPLGPEPHYFAFGNLLHQTMAALYEKHPGELPDAPPDDWQSEVAPEVDRQAEELGLSSDSPRHRGQRARARALISGFLSREARRTGPALKPAHLETGFGFEGTPDAVEMDGWKLMGRVDRIDVAESGLGMVIDYKTGSSSTLTRAEITKKRKLQLQLYMFAIQESEAFGLVPVAGLYVPMGSSKPDPRGIFDKDRSAELQYMGLVSTDGTDTFKKDIEAAVALANQAVNDIRHGVLEHDPATCPNHSTHNSVPDRTVEEDPKAPPPRVTVR